MVSLLLPRAIANSMAPKINVMASDLLWDRLVTIVAWKEVNNGDEYCIKQADARAA